MINRDRAFFQYKSENLVSPLTSQLCIASCKVSVKYVGPVVIYTIIDPHNYLLMTLDGIFLRGLFEHERLKPVNIGMSRGNVQNLIKASFHWILRELISFDYNRPLRSAANHDIPIVKCNTTLVHNSSFSSAGPRLWNALPNNIKAITTLSEFKSKLKTHLFRLSYNLST